MLSQAYNYKNLPTFGFPEPSQDFNNQQKGSLDSPFLIQYRRTYMLRRVITMTANALCVKTSDVRASGQALQFHIAGTIIVPLGLQISIKFALAEPRKNANRFL